MIGSGSGFEMDDESAENHRVGEERKMENKSHY